ncbi:MAG: DUF1987 domain-containing protein [Methylophilus sp.]|jgi:hypothetical protein
MENLYIKATNDSCEVDFRYSENQLTISGEAFPEDANRFFYPIFMWLVEYLKTPIADPVNFNFKLTYFNSASTKMLFNIFQLLNNYSANHQLVILNWYYDEDDDNIKDFGDDVAEDFPSLEFNPVVTSIA